MSLNLSNAQITRELDLSESDLHAMSSLVRLSGELEADELYMIAGHKGQPDEVKKEMKAATATAERQAGPSDCRRR